MRRPFFAILGGMGTIATESYVRLLNMAANAADDQSFFDYVVFNDAGVHDRTDYILDHSCPNPFPALADDVQRASLIGADFMVLICNTAHYFYEQLQALTNVPILNMPQLAIDWAKTHYPLQSSMRMAFLGTSGTAQTGIYRDLIENAGYVYVLPDEVDQKRVDDLIFREVKACGTGQLNSANYLRLLSDVLDEEGKYRADVIVLGCFSLSMA